MSRRTRAEATSPGGWGEVASAAMSRYPEPTPSTTRRRCPWCAEPRRCTHAGMANGLALMAGCEFHVAMWVRNGVMPEPSR